MLRETITYHNLDSCVTNNMVVMSVLPGKLIVPPRRGELTPPHPNPPAAPRLDFSFPAYTMVIDRWQEDLVHALNLSPKGMRLLAKPECD